MVEYRLIPMGYGTPSIIRLQCARNVVVEACVVAGESRGTPGPTALDRR